MACNYFLAFNHRRRLFHRRRPSAGVDRDQRRHIHSRALARHPSHLGRRDRGSVLQHLLRKAPSSGGRNLLQRPHLQLCPGHSLPLGDDTDQAERCRSVHAVHRQRIGMAEHGRYSVGRTGMSIKYSLQSTIAC